MCAKSLNRFNQGDPSWKDCILDEEVSNAYSKKLKAEA